MLVITSTLEVESETLCFKTASYRPYSECCANANEFVAFLKKNGIPYDIENDVTITYWMPPYASPCISNEQRFINAIWEKINKFSEYADFVM